MPFTTELQSDIEEIEKHASGELKKLKEVENVEYINAMQKQHKDKFAAVQEQIKDLSKLAIEINKTSTEGQNNTKVSEENVGKVKTKLIALFKTTLSSAFTMKKDIDTISNKMKISSDALSKLRDDLVKVEQMEYNLLLSQKNFQTDATSSIRSSVAQISFAIMFIILF